MKKSEILSKIEEGQIPPGEGSATWSYFGETRLPSSSEADRLEGFGIPLDVDPEIRNLVLRLNKEGYVTRGSCAGHKNRGFLVLDKDVSGESKREIKFLMREYGLRNISRGKSKDWYSLTFSPVGRTFSKRRKS